MTDERAPSQFEALWAQLDRYQAAGVRRVLLFAHPGFDACTALLDEWRKRLPGLEVTIFSHVPLSPKQVATLGVHEVISFDRSARNSMAGMLKAGLRCLARVRRSQCDAFVVWYQNLMVSPDRFFLEAFGTATGIRRRIAFDDLAGRVYSLSTARLLARFPAVIAKNLSVAGLVIFTGLRLRLLRVRAPGRSAEPIRRVVFVRGDIELALGDMPVGGSVSHTKGIINALRSLGVDVETFAPGQLAGVDERIQHRIQYSLTSDVPREALELRGTAAMTRSIRAHDSRPQLVYQRHSLYNYAGPLIARRFGVPLVLEVNNSEVNMRLQFSRLLFKRLARRCENWVFAQASRLIVVSEKVKEELIALGVEAERIEVIPNGVDPEQFAPQGDTAAIRRRLGFGPEHFVAGFSGLFYPWHGLTYLAKALPHLLKSHPQARLLLVGDGDEKANVVAELQRAEVEDRVVFTGRVPHEEMPAYLSAMDVLVAPHAPWEGFFGSPIKLFEYLAMGKPVIASNVGQMAAIIQDGCNGLLVPAGDPQALAAALGRLADDPGLRDRLGAQARRDALARHTWRQNATRILELVDPAARQGGDDGHAHLAKRSAHA